MRLIDADALLNKMQKDPLFDLVERYGVSGVINAESTVDAVPVIRCCDCKHFEYFEDQFVQMTHCDVHDRCPDFTDYCSWAEKKEK